MLESYPLSVMEVQMNFPLYFFNNTLISFLQCTVIMLIYIHGIFFVSEQKD